MGTGCKTNHKKYRTILENISTLIEIFPYNDGYFGEIGNNKNDKMIRHIICDEPQITAKNFYDIISNSSNKEPIFYKSGDIKGEKAILADGSIIVYRPVSNSDGSPAIQIDIENCKNKGHLKTQKIHFIKRKEQ